jgi:uncharacterized protein (DUF2252 family)
MAHEDAAQEQAVAPSDFASRKESGKAERKRLPRVSHAEWEPPADRPDPVALLEGQAESRVPELVPIRYSRMMVSPFTFFRGAALLMATDLGSMPSSGLIVQLCGDAHLSNFGVFGTPERRLVFDVNDFDETLPGPFEWDVKRLAASIEVAGRYGGFSASDRRAIDLMVTHAYREAMRRLADAGVLDAWYDSMDSERLLGWIHAERRARRAGSAQVKNFGETIAKARTRDSLKAFDKLVRPVDGALRIIADPPLIVPIEDLGFDDARLEGVEQEMRGILETYRSTLPGQRHPIEEFSYVHMARKVVGVGSVGTRAWILLFRGRDDQDPLLLQAKEAESSVLEAFAGASEFDNHGERVVKGQRLMQAASDLFLGWQRMAGANGASRDFYVRQLHDWKGSANLERANTAGALLYARLCGETLARAHGRSGDRVAIASYLGRTERFDEAIADFAADYADQNERDFDAFTAAVSSGRIVAAPGL